jgi:F0F1-type ATP synthase membrane subunit b/b'
MWFSKGDQPMSVVSFVIFIAVMFFFVRPRILKAQKKATTVMLPRKK